MVATGGHDDGCYVEDTLDLQCGDYAMFVADTTERKLTVGSKCQLQTDTGDTVSLVCSEDGFLVQEPFRSEGGR